MCVQRIKSQKNIRVKHRSRCRKNIQNARKRISSCFVTKCIRGGISSIIHWRKCKK